MICYKAIIGNMLFIYINRPYKFTTQSVKLVPLSDQLSTSLEGFLYLLSCAFYRHGSRAPRFSRGPGLVMSLSISQYLYIYIFSYRYDISQATSGTHPCDVLCGQLVIAQTMCKSETSDHVSFRIFAHQEMWVELGRFLRAPLPHCVMSRPDNASVNIRR